MRQDDRAACREWVHTLGGCGLVVLCRCTSAHGGAWAALGIHAHLVIIRETLSQFSPLADFAFAMQGLGSGAITLAGTPAQQAHGTSPRWHRGEMIAAFALE